MMLEQLNHSNEGQLVHFALSCRLLQDQSFIVILMLFYFFLLFWWYSECYKLLHFYSSLTIVFSSQGRMIVPLSPSQEMNYNYSFLILKKFVNVRVYSFFFLKSCRKISRTCDQITHYIYFFLTINQALLKRTKLELYNPEHLSWSHTSNDQVRPQFTKPFQLLTKPHLASSRAARFTSLLTQMKLDQSHLLCSARLQVYSLGYCLCVAAPILLYAIEIYFLW